MADGSPKILLAVRWGVLSPEVHAVVHVLIEHPDRDPQFLGRYERFAGVRGPNAEEQAKRVLRPFLEALKKEGPGVSAERMGELAAAWERGDLHEVH